MRTRHLAGIAAGLAVVVATGLVANSNPVSAGATGQPPECVYLPPDQPPPPPGEPGETTVTTLEQAYWCVLANYYSGPVLDNRTLLLAAFQTLTEELQRRGLDRPTAATPAFTGEDTKDWAAFRDRYNAVLAALPQDKTVHQELAAATLRGMTESLHDDHVTVIDTTPRPGPGQGKAWGLGIHTQPVGGTRAENAPEQTPPLYLDFVFPGSPAAAAGLRPGDIIVAVNGVDPYVNGQLAPGAVAWLYRQYPNSDKVRVTVRRPATGKTWKVTMTPAAFPWGVVPDTPAKVVAGGIAQVTVPGFFPGVTDKVLQAIENLREDTTLRGLILDLRGNNGGSADEVGKLLGAFAHDKVWGSFCDVHDQCTPQRTDDTTPLLDLPLVVLTDRGCASACDAFAGAVQDHRVGTLVGARTAGVASGPAIAYRLDDNKTEIHLPKLHALGAKGQVIAGIGVPPDHFAPRTPADLSAGRDPGVAKALELLKGQ